ncbi:drebrin-like protein B [Pholidichthys leucotaenia]
MAVNLSKNGAALMAAYKKVVDGKLDTDWALFTYEGNSNDLRLSGTGDGGLEELVEELNSGKVMYAFCRVQDPNSGLPKYVLINWTGEGVKDSRKGMCANHVSSIAGFLKGAHITINARAEEDVEPEVILAKVAKASGASYNFHKQTDGYRDVPRGTVGSVYQKTNAVDEIKQINREDFWSQAQRDEEVRRKEEMHRKELDRQKLEKERMEMEEKQSKERERMVIIPRGSAYQKTNAVEEIKQINREDFWSQAQRDEEMRRKEEMRQKELERQKLEKEQMEMEEKQSKERERMVTIHRGSAYQKTNAVEEIKQINREDFWSQAQRDEEIRRKEEMRQKELERQKLEKERMEMEEKQSKEREKIIKERTQRIQQEKMYQKQREEEERQRDEQRRNEPQDNTVSKTGINFAASVQKANEAKSLISQREFNPRDLFKQREKDFEANNSSSPTARRPGKLKSPFLSQKSFDRESPEPPHHPPAVVLPSVVSSPSPAASASPLLSFKVYTEEEEWSDEFEDDVELASQETPVQDMYEASQPAEIEEDLYQNVLQNTPPPNDSDVVYSGQGICARALYDYQAADDTEITFDPDDIITEIDMLDEGWWRGYGPDGHYGLFPANYVELLQ